MSSEQNAPEVQMYQGPPSPPAQMDGQMDQNRTPQMDQNGPAGCAQHPARHGAVQEQPTPPPQAQEQVAGRPPAGCPIRRPEHPGQFVGDLQAGEQILASGGQPQNFQAGEPQQQSGAGPSTKRWKKKFRDRDRPRTQDNLGNQANPGLGNGAGYRDANSHQPGNGGSFKRKGKQQRGPRSFVGPMDHSYRAVNGNFADAPPSTIEAQGNYHGRGGGARSYVSDSQPIDYSIGRPIPIPDDAPTKIYFFIEDLFFNAKITETARKLGVKVAFIKNDKDAIAELTDSEEADRPGLIVFDLNNANAKPMTLIPKLKAKLKKSTSIVGFLSHLQNDLRAKAIEAGCDTVMPRSAFSQNLPNLLRRYGLQEDEEDNFNQ